MVNISKLTIWQKIGMFFYTKRPVTLFLWLAAIVFGVMSYTSWMRREGFPSVNVPVGVVQIVSFNQTAEEVDEQYALPIITELQSSSTVKDIGTTSSDQGSSIGIIYNEGTDVQKELDALKTSIAGKIPQTAQVIFIKVDGGKLTDQGEDIIVSVHQSGLSPSQLDEAASKLAPILKDRLSLASGVRAASLIETVDSASGPVAQQVHYDRYYNAVDKVVEPSSLIAIKGVDGVDQLKLYDQVKEVLGSDAVGSVGAKASISANFAESIREQISGLQENLFSGLIVVLVVSFILISLRGSVITALAMSTTVIATVGVLQLIGYSLNTITLFSLVLCLALIVDDTTIVVEAIDAGLKKGDKFKVVVSESFKKVARASATGTFTTILAFAPMLFIGGILGQFIRAIPVTIIISLLVSLIVSFVFIPFMMRLTYGRLKDGVVKSRTRFMDKVEGAVGSGISRLILWSAKKMKRKVFTRVGAVLLSLVFIVAGVIVFTKVQFNIFPPPKDGNEIFISGAIIDRETATIENTEAVSDKVFAAVVSELGENLVSMTLAGQGGFADRDGFFADVYIKPTKDRDITSVELAKRLQEKLVSVAPEMRLSVESAGVGPPDGSFAVQIAADDKQAAYKLAGDVQEFLSITELERLDGTTARLKDTRVTPSTVVVRDGKQRIINVNAGFYEKDTSTLVTLAQTAVEERFNSQALAGYGLGEDAISFNFGQEEENQDSFASMGAAAGPLFLAMFVLMALLFRSLLQPILIFTALPFAFFGVAAGLYLTNNPISFFSMLGVFALIGISLNNTILLTDYANQARAEGMKSSEAIASAVRERLRPLLTTSITSIFALLPLALNDPFWEGLAYALVFGLLSSTVLVLIVFPYFYLISTAFGDVLKKLFRTVVKR